MLAGAVNSERLRFDGLLQTLSAILLALGTLGSAWCAYQVTLWNGNQSDAVTSATTARVESSKQAALAATKVAYDASLVSQYAQAVAAGQQDLVQFYRQQLFRPEFLPVLDKWLGTTKASAQQASNFFSNQDYLNSVSGPVTQLENQAQQFDRQSERAGRTADSYILLTVVLATSLFFAGISSNYTQVPLKVSLLAVSAVIIAACASRIAGLPMA